MSKLKPRRNRKYCPSRARQAMTRDILSTTYFYHLSCMDTVGARCCNTRYNLAQDVANYIINRRNTWAGIVVVFCKDAEGVEYVKTELLSYSEPHTRAEVTSKVDDKQLALVKSCDVEHLCSAGFFLVPDHLVDIESQREEILSLLEQHGPYDYMRTALAGMVREDALRHEKGAA